MKIKTDYNNRKITLYHTECTASTNLDAKAIKKTVLWLWPTAKQTAEGEWDAVLYRKRAEFI